MGKMTEETKENNKFKDGLIDLIFSFDDEIFEQIRDLLTTDNKDHWRKPNEVNPKGN